MYINIFLLIFFYIDRLTEFSLNRTVQINVEDPHPNYLLGLILILRGG